MQSNILTETEELIYYKGLYKTRATAIIVFFILGFILGCVTIYSIIYFGKITLPEEAIENQLDANEKTIKESKSEFQ